MSVLLAIHGERGSFSDRWIEYCGVHGINHKLVNCHDTTIVAQLQGVDGLLWNWSHERPEDQLLARQVVTAVEAMGVRVFPNAPTSWHYDDKIAQKYLLEAVGAPLIPAHVFVDKKAARAWIEKATFPKVFKLRCGAGSSNVVLVKSRKEALAVCRRMFGRGRAASSGGYFSDFRRKTRQTRSFRAFVEKLMRMPASVCNGLHAQRFLPRQKGYVYFQDFLPGNAFDTRVTVIGDRAFSFMRMNRPGDFRASGSGSISYDVEKIDRRCIQVAFDVVGKLGAQTLAFDFLFDDGHNPGIVEISYTYKAGAVFDCPGYWDSQLNWYEGHYWPQDLILQDLLSEIGK